MKYIRLFLFSLMAFLSLAVPGHAQVNQNVVNQLWKGIGGQQKWVNTTYILFSTTKNSSFIGERKFLMNRKNGDCRFEGQLPTGEQLVVLFNYKSAKAKKIFINRKELIDQEDFVKNQFATLMAQFKKDAMYVFLPTLLENPQSKLTSREQKIINTQKMQVATLQYPGAGQQAELYIHVESGQIKQLVDPQGNEYLVNGFKDVGGGLILPTVFKNRSDSTKNYVYSTVAAFTEMEQAKFNTL